MPIPIPMRATLILALGLLVGCAERLYEHTLVQPSGAEAESCLGRCQRPTEECEARQNWRVQECNERHTLAMADYDLCIGNGGGARCTLPDPCLPADMGICEQQREDCVLACGGRVERHLRSGPWGAPSQSAAPQGESGPTTAPKG